MEIIPRYTLFEKNNTFFLNVKDLELEDSCELFVEFIKQADSYYDNLIKARKLTIRYVKLDGKTIFIDSVQGIKFKLFGTGNLVTIYEGTEFNNCLMNLKSNVSVTIGKSRHNITGLKIWGANSRVAIGQDFSCWGVEIRCHEPKSEVIIGDDCMFSEEILVYPTDVHAIYDNNTKEVLNKSEPIIIGNHVWCGRRVSILKGSQISDNSVIGMGSVVVNKFNTSNLVIAGCPARLIKSNINWDRKNSFDYRG